MSGTGIPLDAMDKPMVCCNNHPGGACRAFEDVHAAPRCCSLQDPGGSEDPQAGGAGASPLCQRHGAGADRGQAVQPRGDHTPSVLSPVKSPGRLFRVVANAKFIPNSQAVLKTFPCH